MMSLRGSSLCLIISRRVPTHNILKYLIPLLNVSNLRPFAVAICISAYMAASLPLCAQTVEPPVIVPVSSGDASRTTEILTDEFSTADSLHILDTDTIPVFSPADRFSDFEIWVERDVDYTPDPNRAVWMSALCPGLGQVYNRRYWKLPIIVGGYLGLAYATSWNNTMLTDYTRAYRDIMDTDPTTKSYMNFFPPTVKEEDLDHNWLTNILQSRKNYFRRNRDLCIISMVGVYLLAMVDAYVDASLAHFDISPQLSMDVTPTLIPDSRGSLPSVGMQWAFNF